MERQRNWGKRGDSSGGDPHLGATLVRSLVVRSLCLIALVHTLFLRSRERVRWRRLDLRRGEEGMAEVASGSSWRRERERFWESAKTLARSKGLNNKQQLFFLCFSLIFKISFGSVMALQIAPNILPSESESTYLGANGASEAYFPNKVQVHYFLAYWRERGWVC